MVLDPRSTDDVYDELKTRLTDKIASLSNFTPGGFNDDWVSAYSEQVHEAEVKAQAAQLSGWVDWAGQTDLDEADLNKLDIDGAKPEEIEEYMASSHLDELAKIVGVSRDPGKKATGNVTFTVSSSSVSINEGYEVGTEPESDGSYKSFYVDADGDGVIDESSTASVTPDSGQTEVTVDIIAEDTGDAFNVGAGAITFIPDLKPGIEAVVNDTETSGGADPESDAEFRENIKNAVFSSSQGGTKLGIEGYIQDNSSSDVDVETKEYTNATPPYVDVVVDGGSDSEITELINESRPIGIEHNLVRPPNILFGVRAELVGIDIDKTFVRDRINDYLTELGVGESFSRSQLTTRIIQADSNIETMNSLTVTMTGVTNELHTYQSGTSTYGLSEAPIGTVTDEAHRFISGTTDYQTEFVDIDASTMTVEAIVGGEQITLTRGSTNDYTVVDADGDGDTDTVSLTGNTTPDDGTVMLFSYEHTSGSVTSITDESGDTYTKDTDYAVIDNDGDGLLDTIDWSIGGSSPSDGERFYVDYQVKRSVLGDLNATQYEKISSDSNALEVNTHSP